MLRIFLVKLAHNIIGWCIDSDGNPNPERGCYPFPNVFGTYSDFGPRPAPIIHIKGPLHHDLYLGGVGIKRVGINHVRTTYYKPLF